MVKILHNHSLQHLNSFGLGVKALRLFEPSSGKDLFDFFQHHYDSEPFILLGEGTNTLFTKDVDGLVIHPLIKGISIVAETDKELYVEVGAGENWDSFVSLAVENEWYGAENLSLIPGSVGSVPVQNIGAYGVEAADFIYQVKVFDVNRCRQTVMAGAECRFGYRSSIFKDTENRNLIVTSVVFRLNRTAQYRLDYGDVKSRFSRFAEPSLKNLRQTIITIRQEKLPDPAVVGNGGSFFKNAVVNAEVYACLQKDWPNIPGYPSSAGTVKVPAAWLIEQCGWKGYRECDAGCWPNQPLVLVNYGNATGRQILELSEKIAASVRIKFGISLGREVRVL
jgi:UDP-N-acetylmuramate dehydrogenase